MLNTPEALRAFTSNLSTSVWTASAIGALFESNLADHLREPCSLDELARRCTSLSRAQIAGCLAVAGAAGVVTCEDGRHRLTAGALAFVEPPMRTALAGDLRTQLMQALALLDASCGARSRTGWSHTDERILQSQGDASAALAPMMKRIAASLDDLAARLERPGARFLDVGVGVAAASIALCRAFPALAVVGVDASEVPLAVARRNVAAAGLSERIELRRQPAEELPDEAAFDLAWLPGFFVPTAAAAVPRIHRALRPGGWLAFGVSAPGGSDAASAVWSLVSAEWGGAGMSPAEAEALLRETGFTSVRTLPGPPWAPSMVMGRR
jgi:SAM-dependent methyltransferase